VVGTTGDTGTKVGTHASTPEGLRNNENLVFLLLSTTTTEGSCKDVEFDIVEEEDIGLERGRGIWFRGCLEGKVPMPKNYSIRPRVKNFRIER
jgi:hypothetical protein